MSTSGALALRGDGSNRRYSRQDAGMPDLATARRTKSRDGLPRQTLSKAFFVLVLVCLVFVFLYLIFGLD